MGRLRPRCGPVVATQSALACRSFCWGLQLSLHTRHAARLWGEPLPSKPVSVPPGRSHGALGAPKPRRRLNLGPRATSKHLLPP